MQHNNKAERYPRSQRDYYNRRVRLTSKIYAATTVRIAVALQDHPGSPLPLSFDWAPREKLRRLQVQQATPITLVCLMRKAATMFPAWGAGRYQPTDKWKKTPHCVPRRGFLISPPWPRGQGRRRGYPTCPRIQGRNARSRTWPSTPCTAGVPRAPFCDCPGAGDKGAEGTRGANIFVGVRYTTNINHILFVPRYRTVLYFDETGHRYART